jgi:hypothetical protein
MRDFDDSTLWRISAFERVQQETGTSGFLRLGGPTLLSTTLLADLRKLGQDHFTGDPLEVVAACQRHRESALLYLRCDGLVWPVTLFPADGLYHSPRDMAILGAESLATLALMNAEPPGVRPPGHRMSERVGNEEQYRPLAPLLWALALNGPRKTLLTEISGTAAYRVPPGSLAAQLVAPGALGSAVERLRRESVSLRTVAGWPGLSVERASRLLNALYLASSLIVVRTHPAAQGQPGQGWGLLNWRKTRR